MSTWCRPGLLPGLSFETQYLAESNLTAIHQES